MKKKSSFTKLASIAASVLALCSGANIAASHAMASTHEQSAPFASANRNPFVQIYGLPVAQSGHIQSPQQLTTSLQWEIANSFTEDSVANEAVFIDGETQRTNINIRYGLNDKIEIAVDIPYLQHDGGSLDGFIDDWHDFWALPDGNRLDFTADQIEYSYQQNGETLYSLTRSDEGIGEISFSLGYQLATTDTRQWALRTAIKLPTGDADSLLGSESTDVSLGLHMSDQSLLQDYSLSFHASAGLLWMDEGEVLNRLREDWVLYGSSTLSWQATSAVNLKLQLDANTAFYDSDLKQLGDDSLQLSVGGSIRVSDNWLLDLAVIEDIQVSTSPDVIFHIGIKALQW